MTPTLAPASPRFSLKGWSPQTWLAKNANFVKKTLTGASTATGAIAVTDLASLRAVAIIWGLAAAALVISAGLDVVHYFLSEQPAEPKS